MSSKFSIVIPVYNTAPYLEECVHSVINQPYENLEIICIDDKSEDNSGKILENLKKKDRRISVITLTENHGPGYARNEGIKQAAGTYIIFLDSDDSLRGNIIPDVEAHHDLNAYDILIFNGIAFNDEPFKIYQNKYFDIANLFSGGNVLNEGKLQELAGSCHSACMKIYKKSFLTEKRIYFPDTGFGEDVEFWIKCLLHTNRIGYFDKIGYFRRYRKGSIMTGHTVKNITDRIKRFHILLELTQANSILYNYVTFYISNMEQQVLLTGNKETAELYYSTLEALSKAHTNLNSDKKGNLR